MAPVFRSSSVLPICHRTNSVQINERSNKHTKNHQLASSVIQSALHACTHTFNGPFSGTTQLSRYQKGKTSLDSTEARDREWQWHCTLIKRGAVTFLYQTSNTSISRIGNFTHQSCQLIYDKFFAACTSKVTTFLALTTSQFAKNVPLYQLLQLNSKATSILLLLSLYSHYTRRLE